MRPILQVLLLAFISWTEAANSTRITGGDQLRVVLPSMLGKFCHKKSRMKERINYNSKQSKHKHVNIRLQHPGDLFWQFLLNVKGGEKHEGLASQNMRQLLTLMRISFALWRILALRLANDEDYTMVPRWWSSAWQNHPGISRISSVSLVLWGFSSCHC